MKMAYLVRERSTCLRRKVGAVMVKDGHILSTGYNGAPKGLPHCEQTGCLREKLNVPTGERHELCRGVHAEQNAVIQAAVFGASIKDAILYVTNFPCSVCSKILVNASISEIVFAEGYADDLSSELLGESKIKTRNFSFDKKEE
ncbi:MAG: cytidine/deoxycytidylate deaminase family protein [Thermoplasmata archaeon]|nr:MAG: cytidine/deoxycytidylate deaminase family protein [Thermoplasmata archaeon]